MDETKANFQNQSTQLQNQSTQIKNLEVLVRQMAKILSEEQQVSLPTLEEPRRAEVESMDLHEFVVKEEGSTSPKPIEIRK